MSRISRDVWCDHCDYRYTTQIAGGEGVGVCPNCAKPTLLVACGVCGNQSELSHVNFAKGNWICPQCKEYREFSAETLTDYLTAQIAIEPSSPTRQHSHRRPSIKVGCIGLVILYVISTVLLLGSCDTRSPLTQPPTIVSQEFPFISETRYEIAAYQKQIRRNGTPTPLPLPYIDMYRQTAIDLTDSGDLIYIPDDGAEVAVHKMDMRTNSSQALRLPENIAYVTTLSTTDGGERLLLHTFELNSADRVLYWLNRDSTIEQSEVYQRGIPTFSPDGNKILFAGESNYQDGVEGLFLVSSHDASQERELLWSGRGESPAWSPDGERIAFISEANLYVLTLESLEVEQLTTSIRAEREPVWSPDGASILLAVEGNLYLYDVESGEERKLTDFMNVVVGTPTWTPDGRYVVFSADFDGDFDLYAIDPLESDPLPVRLFDSSRDERNPVWLPVES